MNILRLFLFKWRKVRAKHFSPGKNIPFLGWMNHYLIPGFEIVELFLELGLELAFLAQALG